ncbi:MAG: DMT family transporter, partial [Jatrophihabitantaceae bacterium]
MLSYLFAALAAVANAISSVLQRKANQDQPDEDNLSAKLILDLLHDPIWFGGICGVIAGFLLQAAALANGALSVVEPILVFELPVTLFLGGIVFHRRLHRREWTAALGMTIGLAGLLYFLAPNARVHPSVPWPTWTLGIGVNLAVVAALVVAGWRRHPRGGRGPPSRPPPPEPLPVAAPPPH